MITASLDKFYSGSAYVESLWRPTPRWLIRPGVRADVNADGTTTASSVDPRLTFRYKLRDRDLPELKPGSDDSAVWLKGSAGIYHQPPRFVLPLPGLDLMPLRYGLQRSYQTSLGAEVPFPHRFQLSVEGYFNYMDPTIFDLSVNATTVGTAANSSVLPMSIMMRPMDGQEIVDRLTTPQLGRAYGVEMLLRRQSKTGVFGWVSYTLSHSERYRDGGWAPYDFDRTHLVNVVAGLPLRRNWDIGVRWQYQSGKPTTHDLRLQHRARQRLPALRPARRQARRLAPLAARFLRRRHQRGAAAGGDRARHRHSLRAAHHRSAGAALTRRCDEQRKRHRYTSAGSHAARRIELGPLPAARPQPGGGGGHARSRLVLLSGAAAGEDAGGGAGGAAQQRSRRRAGATGRRALDGGGGRARVPGARGRRPRGRRGAQGGRHRARTRALRAPARVPRHAGKQRALRRPVRHGAGHHPRLSRSGGQLDPGDAGGDGGDRRGAGGHRHRPDCRLARGRDLQPLHPLRRARDVGDRSPDPRDPGHSKNARPRPRRRRRPSSSPEPA